MQIELIAPRQCDVRRTYRWLKSKALREDFMMFIEPNIKTHAQYWRSVLERTSKDLFYSIYVDDVHFGNCGISKIQEDRVGVAWIYLGDPAVRGRGIGKRAVMALVHEARNKQLVELIAHIRTDNAASNRVHRDVGFVEVEKGSSKLYGYDIDVEIYSLKLVL